MWENCSVLDLTMHACGGFPWSSKTTSVIFQRAEQADSLGMAGGLLRENVWLTFLTFDLLMILHALHTVSMPNILV